MSTSDHDPLSDKTFLIGIGAQKAGTTWLGSYFEKHPDIFMSPIKELHYFDRKYVSATRHLQESHFLLRLKHNANGIKTMEDIQRNSLEYQQLKNYIDIFEMKTVEDYLNFFRKRVGAQKVMCEITPGYALLTGEQMREIATMHPRVKFLFLLRDPVQRFWSNLRFYGALLKGFDPLEQFEVALNDWAIMGRTDYMRTLHALSEATSEENKLVTFYEQLFRQSTVEKICEFAGVAPKPARLDKKVFTSEEIPIAEDKLKKAYERLAPVYHGLYQATGGKLPQEWLDTMQRFEGTEV